LGPACLKGARQEWGGAERRRLVSVEGWVEGMLTWELVGIGVGKTLLLGRIAKKRRRRE